MVNKGLLAFALESAYKEAQRERKRNQKLVETLMLGTTGNRERHDLSEYLVHFTKEPKAYWKMLNILGSQKLKAGLTPFGCSRNIDKKLDSTKNRAICFSETPLGFMQRFASKRSEYGIGFSKRFILERGGMPIWYVPAGSSAFKALHKSMTSGKERDPADRRRKLIKYEDPIWDLCPLIEETRDFGFIQHQFQWEREWRLVAREMKFKVRDVAFLVIPEALHVNARQFFRDAERENTGPAYLDCPYIDGSWDLAKYSDSAEKA